VQSFLIMADPQIIDIQRRAEAASLDMAPVLADAGVAASTWYRWKTGRVGPNLTTRPNLTTLRRVQDALERRLATRDAA
jgi:hypothetical protein